MSNELTDIIGQIKQEKNIFTKAKLIEQLIKDRDIKIKDLGSQLMMKSSYICHLLRLKRLPEAVIDGYYSKSVSVSHLFIISRLKDQSQMMLVYEKVLSDNLPVQKTEEAVRDILYGIETKGEYLNREDREHFINEIKSAQKNVSINIVQTRIKSKLIIEIKGSLEQTGGKLKSLMQATKKSLIEAT